ncbi:MAG: SRPBCC family protein [Acidimicrobiales bacterium]
MRQRATESIVVNAPPQDVFSVVIDVERYVEWVSEVKSIEIIERDAVGRPLEVEFRAAAFGRSTTYALRYDYGRAPEELNWYQAAGDITADLRGQYRFEPIDSATNVVYDLEVDLAVPIPAFVKARAAHRIQSEALRDLKERVESLR